MSLLSAVILPMLEKQIMALEPQIAEFVLSQLKDVGHEVIEWIESKLGIPTAPTLPDKSVQ